jgi:glycosyltransferase involved in cell wall biosynthesis
MNDREEEPPMSDEGRSQIGNAPALLFVNRYFHPDHSATSQMLTDLAIHLARSGRRVGVITSRQRYDDPEARLPASETVEGIEIHRVATTRFGRASLAGRAIDYLTFYVTAFLALLRHADRRTIVIAMTDPPLISVIAALACLLRGAVLVNWVHDLFPEIANALGVGGKRAGGVLLRLRDWSLRRARVNVALGETMASRIEGRGGHAAVVPNWADGEAIAPVAPERNTLRREWNLDGRFVVGYSGNLGRAHEFATLTGAMQRLGDDGNVRFVLIGAGAQLGWVQQHAGGLSNVQFRPYQPRESLGRSLSVADAHVISLLPALEGLVVPSKFYGVLAAGRPTLFIGSPSGELARLIARHDCGITVAPGDDEALVQAIRALAADPARAAERGRNARALFEREYDRPIAMKRWEETLTEAGSPR